MTKEDPIDLRHTAREGWSEERVKALRQHLHLGLSATESGKLLGLKRNAVCGKRWRLGLRTDHDITLANRIRGNLVRWEGHISTYKPKKSNTLAKKRPKMNGLRDIIAAQRVINNIKPKEPLPEIIHGPSEFSCTIIELDLYRCKFPVGEAVGADQLYCGRRKAETDAYCPHCKKIAYTPPKMNMKEYMRGLRFYYERR